MMEAEEMRLQLSDLRQTVESHADALVSVAEQLQDAEEAKQAAAKELELAQSKNAEVLFSVGASTQVTQ